MILALPLLLLLAFPAAAEEERGSLFLDEEGSGSFQGLPAMPDVIGDLRREMRERADALAEPPEGEEGVADLVLRTLGRWLRVVAGAALGVLLED